MDYEQLTENLRHFYDFTGKIVLLVGAGRGNLLPPEIRLKKLIAIDQDPNAHREFALKRVPSREVRMVELLPAKFENIILFGDVVYFEFCLHEMSDPKATLIHASELAPEIVVFDHSPSSKWIYHVAEEDKIHRSFDALKHFGIHRRKRFRIEQNFRDYEEFLAKVSTQGSVAAQRAKRYFGAANIAIPMEYELVLLRGYM